MNAFRTSFDAQGTGGGLAARPVVPQEHPGRPIPEKWRRRQGQRRQDVTGVREGEHGRRAVPAQGGPEDVRELPGAVQGAPEDVQLLHHRYVRRIYVHRTYVRLASSFILLLVLALVVRHACMCVCLSWLVAMADRPALARAHFV